MLVNWQQPSLWLATAAIIFNPLFWNIVARQEYNNKILTKLAGGNAYRACYMLAAAIFSLGILRDHLFKSALDLQPTLASLGGDMYKALAVVSFLTGTVLVVSSMWTLGITGTYLGDYSGILMDKKVESFPFNVTDNPMYYGSTMSFFGTSLWYQSPAGLLLTILVFVEYKIALTYEEPFTAAIYAARDAAAKIKLTKPVSTPKKAATPLDKKVTRSTAIADFVPRESRARTALTAEEE